MYLIYLINALNIIQVYSFVEIELVELPFRTLKHRAILKGKFDDNSASGNILCPDFLNNPKHILKVKRKEDYQFKVDGPNEASLMIIIIAVGEVDLSIDDVSRIPFQNFLKYNPGFYFQGFSSYKHNMEVGTYLILISNQNKIVIINIVYNIEIQIRKEITHYLLNLYIQNYHQKNQNSFRLMN